MWPPLILKPEDSVKIQWNLNVYFEFARCETASFGHVEIMWRLEFLNPNEIYNEFAKELEEIPKKLVIVGRDQLAAKESYQ